MIFSPERFFFSLLVSVMLFKLSPLSNTQQTISLSLASLSFAAFQYQWTLSCLQIRESKQENFFFGSLNQRLPYIHLPCHPGFIHSPVRPSVFPVPIHWNSFHLFSVIFFSLSSLFSPDSFLQWSDQSWTEYSELGQMLTNVIPLQYHVVLHGHTQYITEN